MYFRRINHRLSSRTSICLSIALAISLAACADSPTGTLEAPTQVSGSVAVVTPSEAYSVAQGLALAMRDPAIRGLVHSAMRGSRFSEHKLVLQDLLTTPEGERVLAATAARLGQTLNAVKSSIANLPALDFYLPFKGHRQSWKSTSDVYVAVTFDPDAPAITAYGTNGQTLTLRKGDGVPAVPLIILHPAEPKSTRSDLLANGDEELIESPTVGATRSIASAPAGPAFLVEPCEGCGGGGGGGGIAPGTYINHFNIKQDDGWFGNSEMRFHSSAVVGWQFEQGQNGTSWFLISQHSCPKGTYSQDGVDTSAGYDGLFLISPTVTRGSFLTCNGFQAQYAIQIIEDDGGLNGEDDDFGWRIYAAGYYPSGAMYDPYVNSFYKETFPNGQFGPLNDADRSAYLRIIVY